MLPPFKGTRRRVPPPHASATVIVRKIRNRRRLTDQLVSPLLREDAVSVLVDVEAVRCARRGSIQENLKLHGLA